MWSSAQIIEAGIATLHVLQTILELDEISSVELYCRGTLRVLLEATIYLDLYGISKVLC